MGPTYRETKDQTSAVAVGLSVADESRRVQEAAQALGGLDPDASIDELRDAVQTGLHRLSALGMSIAQASLTMSDDQRQRHREYLRIEARLMRIENQIRRNGPDKLLDYWPVIVLVLLAFLGGAVLF